MVVSILHNRSGTSLYRPQPILEVGNLTLQTTAHTGGREPHSTDHSPYRRLGTSLYRPQPILEVGNLTLQTTAHTGGREPHSTDHSPYRRSGTSLYRPQPILEVGNLTLQTTAHTGGRERHSTDNNPYWRGCTLSGEREGLRLSTWSQFSVKVSSIGREGKSTSPTIVAELYAQHFVSHAVQY